MSTDREEAGTVPGATAARDRGRSRLRAVTVAIGAASVLAGGAIAYTLPGAAQAQATSPATQGSSGSTGSSGTSSTGTGNSSTGKSSSGSSGSGGLQSSSPPSGSSGSGQVTSGGS